MRAGEEMQGAHDALQWASTGRRTRRAGRPATNYAVRVTISIERTAVEMTEPSPERPAPTYRTRPAADPAAMKQSTPDKPGNGMRILAFSIGLVLFLLGVVILFSANGLQFGALVLGGTMA